VDLGLVYKCEVESLEDGKKKVKVQFTLTAPGCGMGDFLREDVRGKLLAIPSVGSADVEVVLEPPWDHSMMSDGARLQLGLM
jgi:metal-sulfur cluster biosynthetic enzyme